MHCSNRGTEVHAIRVHTNSPWEALSAGPPEGEDTFTPADLTETGVVSSLRGTVSEDGPVINIYCLLYTTNIYCTTNNNSKQIE